MASDATQPVTLPRSRALSSLARLRLVAWAPFVGWTVYVIALLILFRFGPFEWRYREDPTLYGFIFIVQVASGFGFALGLARPLAHPRRSVSIDKVVRILAVLSTIGIILTIIDQYRSGPSLMDAIADPANSRRTWIDTRGTSLVSYIAQAFSIAHFPLLATALGYWKAINTPARWAVLSTALGMCLVAVWNGSRAGMHAIVVVALFFSVTALLTGRAIASLRTIAITAAVVFVAFAGYSGYISSKRASKKTIDYTKYVMRTSSNVDVNHAFINDAPTSVSPLILSGSFYLSHGFDGLAACLHKPFIGVGFGLGHSAFLMRTWEKLTGDSSINSLSCFTRLMEEDGYSGALWVTIYAWIWSDVGFFGTPLFFVLMAYVFASSWRDYLQPRGSAIASWILGWLVYTVAVTPIIFPPGDYGALLGFWGSGLVWAVLRSRITVTC